MDSRLSVLSAANLVLNSRFNLVRYHTIQQDEDTVRQGRYRCRELRQSQLGIVKTKINNPITQHWLDYLKVYRRGVMPPAMEVENAIYSPAHLITIDYDQLERIFAGGDYRLSYGRLSRVERTKRIKMNRPAGKQPAEARIRPLWGRRQLEIKGSNIGADSWSVDAEEEGLENRHNYHITTT